MLLLRLVKKYLHGKFHDNRTSIIFLNKPVRELFDYTSYSIYAYTITYIEFVSSDRACTCPVLAIKHIFNTSKAKLFHSFYSKMVIQ